jgi:hypothetical protein
MMGDFPINPVFAIRMLENQIVSGIIADIDDGDIFQCFPRPSQSQSDGCFFHVERMIEHVDSVPDRTDFSAYRVLIHSFLCHGKSEYFRLLKTEHIKLLKYHHLKEYLDNLKIRILLRSIINKHYDNIIMKLYHPSGTLAHKAAIQASQHHEKVSKTYVF